MKTLAVGDQGDYEYIDAETIKKAVSGDELSLCKVIAKYQPYLWVILRNRMVSSGTEIDFATLDDIRAAVIAKLYLGIRKFRLLKESEREIEKMFDSYCKTIIKHEIRDELGNYISEQKKYTVLSFEELESYLSLLQAPELLNLIEIRLGESLILLEDEKLSEELLRLRPTYQRVIELSFFLGYSDREIARILGLKISSVYEYKHKALLTLKKALKAL